MNKRFLRISTCLLLALLLLLPFAGTAEKQFIYDRAGKFTVAERAVLEQKARDILATHGVDVIIVTTENSHDKGPMLYAADFYESVRDYKNETDYLSFALAFDIGEYGEAAYGRPRRLLTGQGDDALGRLLRPHFKKKDYYSGMAAYLNYVDHVLQTGSSDIPDFLLPTPLERMQPYLLWVTAGGLIIAFIVVESMKAKMKIGKLRSNAREYCLINTLNLSKSNDIFLYESTTRRRIETHSSSGSHRSGGGGGGRSFSSSSGRSYGGRSGKL